MMCAALLVSTFWFYTNTATESAMRGKQANIERSYSGALKRKRSSAGYHGVPPCSTQGGLSINIAHTS